MDKNTITGFVLIGIVMVGFSWFNRPTAEQLEAQQRYNDSIANIAETNQTLENKELEADFLIGQAEQAVSDSVRQERLINEFGVFASALSGENKEFKIENEVLDLTFSTRGGMLSGVSLKDYKRYDGSPLILFDESDDKYGFSFTTANNRVLSTSELYFDPVEVTDSRVVMRLNAGPDSSLDFVYTISEDSYLVDFNIEQRNMSRVLAPSSAKELGFSWEQRMRRQEKGERFEEQYSNIYYKELDDDVDYLSSGSDEKETFEETLKWIGYKNQFFTSAIISTDGFDSAVLNSKISETEGYLKSMYSQANVSVDLNQATAASFVFYVGPNSYPLLKGISRDLEEKMGETDLDNLVPLGSSIFRWVNEFLVLPVFTFLGKFISNYGIIILLLTIIIKLILSPFSYKAFLSQAKMRVLRPEIQKINDKYPGKDQAMERQQATMAFYSQAGISPMGGCLPMLLQMPILFALFQFFPSSIELRGQSFLWATDLSSYDSIYRWSAYIPLVTPYFGNHISLFCLLMTITNLIYIHMSMNANSMGQETMPGMKSVQYLMPIMFMVFFNNYAAGLSYYYFLSLLITIGQTYAFRLFLNEDKLRQKIKEDARKPKKKSGFMARLEEAQRLQQENMKRQQQNKK